MILTRHSPSFRGNRLPMALDSMNAAEDAIGPGIDIVGPIDAMPGGGSRYGAMLRAPRRLALT